VHTGGGEHFARLIRKGYVQVVLAGNALAVHDIEYALSGTSLGIDLVAGAPVDQGHRNHMAAINTVNRAGGIRQAVETGVVKSGVMYECVKNNVEYVLAGSIRDDGPLPDTIMDLVEAQDRYAEALQNVQLVLMLSSMLHSIGVGNMLPSWVRVVCVDINPAVVTKLSDRGSMQTVGVVTDVGLFLHHLANRLE
jgi:lysine-ketoglutarate reductase/saccharopine dehydrogenase-like protein (TIGR00300 family)